MEVREKKDVVKLIINNLSPMVEIIKEHMPVAAPVFELMLDNWVRYDRAKEEGQPVAWLNFATPPELFYAMDILPVVYDGIASQVSKMGMGIEYIDLSEQYVPDHLCSDNKIHLGVALAGEVPFPDIMVYPSSPCDSNRAALSALCEYANIPQFVIDLPYYKNEHALAYVAEEMKRLVMVLEELTGRKLDIDKLREVMGYSNLAHHYYNKLDELRQQIPCPFSSMEMYLDGGALIQFAGLSKIAEYYKTRYEDTKAKLDRGERRDVKEKIRVVWAYGVYIADLNVFSWLEEKYGAVSINCMNFNWVVKPTEDLSTYDSMLRGLAEKATLMPMNREVHGPIENFLEATIDLCKRNSADCAIITGHVACKSNWAVYKLIKDKLEEELGIPLLVFEVDLFDPRLIDPDGVKVKLEEFFETRVIPGLKR